MQKTQNSTTDKPLIPNKQIEEMFFRIATDDQIETYIAMATAGKTALASAYASRFASKKFYEMLEKLGE